MELVEQLVMELNEIYPDFNYQNISNIIDTTIKDIADHKDFYRGVNYNGSQRIYSRLLNIDIDSYTDLTTYAVMLYIRIKDKSMHIDFRKITDKIIFLNEKYKRIDSVTPIWLIGRRYLTTKSARLI